MINDAIMRWNPWWADASLIEKLSGTERAVTQKVIATLSTPHIKDIIGVRRCGKTTLLYQVINHLIKKKTPPKNIIYLNFDDPSINSSSFDDILKYIEETNPGMEYVFLDEIQQKAGWERWLRTIYDQKTFKEIFISGSSASLLTEDTGRVLTGRHITTTVYPFSFREYLEYNGWTSFSQDYLKYNMNKLLHYQKMYLSNGGFPEVLESNDYERKTILINLYTDILTRDIVSRYGASFDYAKKISYYLLSNSAKEFSYRRISDSVGQSVETVEKYVGYFKESFLIQTLDFFSYKVKIQFKQNKKAYAIDSGMMNAASFAFSSGIGKIFETIVFLELKRRGKDIYYWKDENQREVDFLVMSGPKISELIQVCYDLDSESKKDNLSEKKSAKKREVDALLAAMDEFKLDSATIITKDRESKEKIGAKTIYYVPLCLWLLNE